jgi:hypothetical protein
MKIASSNTTAWRPDAGPQRFKFCDVEFIGTIRGVISISIRFGNYIARKSSSLTLEKVSKVF